jgi:glycosyltransferase involved in cell wall biosynthesis
MIEEGRTGYTFGVGNADSLADKLIEMAAGREAGLRPQQALQRIVAKYSIESAVRGTLDCLEKVGNNMRHSR